MRFIKSFYPEHLNTIMFGCLPVWHFSALFLNFIFINHHILLFQFHHFFFQITQPFSLFIVFFLYTPYYTPEFPTFFSIWYVSITTPCFSIELAVNFLLVHFEKSINLYCWILCSYRDILAGFASILCFISSITVVKHLLFTPYFSSTSLALPSLRAPICSFFTFSRMLISFFSYFISSSVRLFHHGSFLFPPSYFLGPNLSATQTHAALIRLFVWVMFFV